jgi:hypothetical protein
VLSPALWWNIRDRTFQNLQQSLLDALAGDIARDTGRFRFPGDLIDLIDIDDAALGALDNVGEVCPVIRGLYQLEEDVLNIFADIAGFREAGGIGNGKRDIEYLRQRLRQRVFPDPVGPIRRMFDF